MGNYISVSDMEESFQITITEKDKKILKIIYLIMMITGLFLMINLILLLFSIR